MITKLLAIIVKNFKQLIGSKSSSLIIIFGPLFLILITGLALSNAGLRDINVGLYSQEDNQLNDILLDKIKENNFNVNILNTIEECKDSVKKGLNHICIEIKPRASELSRYDSRVGYEAIFYVDYSKVRLVWAVINAVRNVVDSESAKISKEIINKVSQNIELVSTTMEENKDTLNDIINTGEFVKENVHNLRNSIGDASAGKDILVPLKISINNQRSILNNLRNNINNTLIPIPGTSQIVYNMYTDINILESELNNLDTNLIKLESFLENKNLIDRDVKSSLLEIENKLDENLKKVNKAKSSLNRLEDELEGIKSVKAEDIIRPIPVSITPVTSQQAASVSNALTYLDYLFPSIIALIITFVSILLSTTLTMKERRSMANFRNTISPTSNYLFLIGLYIFSLILVSIQILILFIVGKIFFNLNITSNLFTVSLILFSFITLLIFSGFIFGYLFNSEETAIVGAVSLSILMFIASGLILPVETMPRIMGNIIKFNPFVLTETALRQVLIFDLPIQSIVTEGIILLVYMALFIALSYIIMKYSKKEI